MSVSSILDVTKWISAIGLPSHHHYSQQIKENIIQNVAWELANATGALTIKVSAHPSSAA